MSKPNNFLWMVVGNIYITNMYNESRCKRCLCVVYRELRSYRRLAYYQFSDFMKIEGVEYPFNLYHVYD